MKLVIMTKSTFFVEEDKILVALFDAGMESLHLYKPNSSQLYLERLLRLLPEDCYSKITIHQHYYLKEEYKLAGIHVDNNGSEVPDGYKGNIGFTCDSIDLLKEMKKKSKRIFLKNTFDNNEYSDGKPAFTAQQLKDASKKGLIDKRVYAVGGVGLDNIKQAKDLGFGGVVILGDLWNRFDIHNEVDFKDLIRHFEKLRKVVS